MMHVCWLLLLVLSSALYASPYFLYKTSRFDVSLAATTIPGTDLTRKNLLRMVTHNALLDAFFSPQPLAPHERLSLHQPEAREELQHPPLLELHRAVALVGDLHYAKVSTYYSGDKPLAALPHLLQIAAIEEDLSSPKIASVAELRLAMIDLLLAKTAAEGSDFLPSILYAIIATAMPPAVRNSKLGSAFVSTTDSWQLRTEHGRPIAEAEIENIDRAMFAALSLAQLDAVLGRAAQALEFIIARHAETAQDGYWDAAAEATARQDYEVFARQNLPVQKQTLARIMALQANTVSMQRREATIDFLLGYVAD